MARFDDVCTYGMWRPAACWRLSGREVTSNQVAVARYMLYQCPLPSLCIHASSNKTHMPACNLRVACSMLYAAFYDAVSALPVNANE